MIDTNKKILIVKDNQISIKAIKQLFKNEKYSIFSTQNHSKEIIDYALTLKPDLILMDIILDDRLSGFDVAMKIHKHNKQIKVVFWADQITKEIIDYALLADSYGYLLRPFDNNELLLHVKLLFLHTEERHKKPLSTNVILQHGYKFNTKLCRLFKKNIEIPLGKKLLRLIEILLKNKNISVSNEQLYTYLWGEPKSDATLRSLVYRIRNTVGYDMIENINGLGYKIKQI